MSQDRWLKWSPGQENTGVTPARKLTKLTKPPAAEMGPAKSELTKPEVTDKISDKVGFVSSVSLRVGEGGATLAEEGVLPPDRKTEPTKPEVTDNPPPTGSGNSVSSLFKEKTELTEIETTDTIPGSRNSVISVSLRVEETRAIPVTPEIAVAPAKQAEFQSAIDEFRQAGFGIKAIRDGVTEPRGIPVEQWRKQQLHKLCDAIREYRPVSAGVQRRPNGESALCRPHDTQRWLEWNYAADYQAGGEGDRHRIPGRLTPSTWAQMRELAASGEYDFAVVGWPESRLLYDSTTDGPIPISEEEPPHE